MKQYTLENGVLIPASGLGTWQSPDDEIGYQAVLSALQSGYRHIDTAQGYRNEDIVGRAVNDSGINREEIFITSKLDNPNHGYYRDTCAVTKEDMIAFLQANTSYSMKKSIKECSANVQLYYGQKELKEIKRSAQIIEGIIPHCTTHELSGLYHGEFSMNQADEYAKIIKTFNSVQ